MSKKSSKYCEHMNEEDFDMEDEEEVQSSEDVCHDVTSKYIGVHLKQ